MLKLGLKIGSKDTQYTNDILEYYDKGIFQYIELFAISGTFHDTISYWKKLNIPFGIHAPHSAAGLNLANFFSRNENLRKITEVYNFANELKAEYVIFHSGINGTCLEVVNQLAPFSDERMLIENKPIKGLDGSFCVGSTYEDMNKIISLIGNRCGFVLDFGHAICAANTLKIDPITFIEKLNKLNPKLYHLTDGIFNSELDSHLHYGEGSFPLEKLLQFVPDNYKITNEAKRTDMKSLIEIKQDFEYLNKYGYTKSTK